MSFEQISKQLFGVSEEKVAEAIMHSPNARGYILGALSELLLKEHLEQSGLQVMRIKEKWEGPKIHHGDFYVSVDGKEWFVLESKGLKTNSEKWANSQKNYFDSLYGDKKQTEMKKWFDRLPVAEQLKLRDEEAQHLVRLCQTHMPSGKATNENKVGGRTQASPRFDEFHVLAVDMYTKTGVHEFVFAQSQKLSRSTKDSNHLLQNYFITLVLQSDLRPMMPLAEPWTENVIALMPLLNSPVNVDDMQVDERKPGERADGVLSF